MTLLDKETSTRCLEGAREISSEEEAEPLSSLKEEPSLLAGDWLEDGWLGWLGEQEANANPSTAQASVFFMFAITTVPF